MDELLVRLGLVVLIGVASVVAAYSAREDYFLMLRSNLARRFTRAKELPRVEQYIRLYFAKPFAGALHPPLYDFPISTEHPIDYVSRAASLTASRFDIALGHTTIRFGPLPGPHAGQVQYYGGTYRIDIADQYQNDPSALFAITAHEVAHVALAKRGLHLEDRLQNEELTDAVTVLSGLGPLILGGCYTERRWSSEDNTLHGSAHRLGYLNPVAMAYLMLVHAELSGVPIRVTRDLRHWLRPALKIRGLVRRQRLRALYGHDPQRRQCITCGARLRLPLMKAKLRIRCPICGFAVTLEMRSSHRAAIARFRHRFSARLGLHS